MAGGELTTNTAPASPSSCEAATLMARPAAPGLPVMKWVSPALPAEATTITPTAAARSEVRAVRSLTLPKLEPSDMLITSR